MRPKAMLLTLRRDNREMEELAFSLGHDLVATVYQSRDRDRADPELFLGRGKLEEARDSALALGVTTILVNADLKPGQVFSLYRFFREGARAAQGSGRERDTVEFDVYDRTRVILEIFKERARSPEARLQVELARLHYEIPLVKESIHLLKRGERPGFLAGGSYEVDTYYDMIKRRMAKIRGELERIRRERDTRRKHRRRGGFDLVSLAGYTNAGKSSLLEALAGETTLVENRYFSTLSTTTRRVLDDRREILVTDTVGFIEDLPPWLVEAFHSTLEEIALADLILLVVDASDPLPEIKRKLRSSLRVLWEHQAPRGTGDLRRAPTPILVVFNKADLVEPTVLDERVASLLAEGLIDENHVAVSAKSRHNLDALLAAIRRDLPGYARLAARFPASPEGERVLHRLHEETDLLTVDRKADGGRTIEARLEVRHELLASIVHDLEAAGGTWLHPDPPSPALPEGAPGASALPDVAGAGGRPGSRRPAVASGEDGVGSSGGTALDAAGHDDAPAGGS